MKTIGLLGGMSWVATIPYYQRLNELIVERLGTPNSASIILYSVNYAPLKNLYHHSWDKIPNIFAEEYKRLAETKPDCILMACNTLHKAYDLVKAELPSSPKFLHAVELTRDHCLEKGIKAVLFVGTTFTMQDDYFIRPLKNAGIGITLPTANEQAEIQQIQARVSQGRILDEDKVSFAEILSRYPNTNGIILVCTELPLVAPESTKQRPLVNPVELQCLAAVEFALSK